MKVSGWLNVTDLILVLIGRSARCQNSGLSHYLYDGVKLTHASEYRQVLDCVLS